MDTQRINSLLLELSRIGEKGLDKEVHVNGINWHAVGLTISHVTDNLQSMVEVAYAALEDWNAHSYCAVLAYMMPSLYPPSPDADFQDYYETVQRIEGVLRRKEIKLKTTDGKILNCRLNVKLEILESHNATFSYLHKPGTWTHSNGCKACEEGERHTDDEHYDQLQRVIDASTQAIVRESISLIASGYDWHCPYCGADNHVIESASEVTCVRCKRTHGVDSAEHV